MKIKNLFRAPQKGNQYYKLDNIAPINADYNLIYGEKANGKSFAVKEECVKHFLETGGECAIIRRYDTEISKFKLERYVSDTAQYISEWSNGLYNDMYVYNKQIFLCNKDGTGKIKNTKRWAYSFALNLAQGYSGNGYPNVDRVILEEFISLDGTYLPNELFNYNHVISTIARRRDIKTYMLANSISRMSPYWREYGVDEFIPTQQQGTVGVIERETDGGIQIVAVEYCDNTENVSRMFAGERGEMINRGKWLTKQMPHLPFSRADCDVLYSFVVEYNTFKFWVEYVSYNGQYCLYVTPKTTAIKPNTRVVSNFSSADNLYSYGFRPLNARERLVFDLIRNGKIFFCDNMTGTEFNEAVKNLGKLAIF